QRALTIEGQQAAVAALRTRFERRQEELRQEESAIAEQRGKQQEAEAILKQQFQDLQRRRADFERERSERAEEMRTLAERSELMEAAVTQMRQVQEAMASQEEQLRLRTLVLDGAA